MLARLLGRPPAAPPPAETAPSLAAYRARVGSGERPGPAAILIARTCLADGDLPGALRLGYALAADPGTAEAASGVRAMCHLAAAGPDQAWRCFATLTDPVLIAACAPEYFQAGFITDRDAAETAAGELTELSSADRPTPEAVLKVARAAFSVDRTDCAGRLIEAAAAGDFGEVDESEAYEFNRLATWLPDGSYRRAPELFSADLRFGVIDYKAPGDCSRNVGDFIQTLASIGHLVRNDQLHFVGDPDLVAFVDGLRESVKAERRRTGPAATIQLVEVQRDGNTYQQLPEPTWAVMFGWYLHPTFAAGYRFPFNPAIRPIFLSFHLNKPEALTEEGVAYLRRYGPVGCRDWHTVAMLTAAGIPAFFSGCLTTTVDTMFTRSGPDRRTETGYIDSLSAADDLESLTQSIDDIRKVSLPDNLALAYEWVSNYHQRYRKIVTSRLHSYLPARSVGCEVDFEPANRSDSRFSGLIDIDEAAFDQIRQGILDKFAAMIDTLAGGAGEEEVYHRWRELCAPDVAFADNYLGSMRLEPQRLPDPGRLPAADRLIMIDAARKPARVARLAKSLTSRYPEIPVVAVGHDSIVPGLTCITNPEAEHNLLMAGVLAALPTGSRAVILPFDAKVPGDLPGLWGTDLNGNAIAARVDVRRNRTNLAVLLRRIGARLGRDWSASLTFLAATHRMVGNGKIPFDPRVAVIDGEKLAAAGWAETAGELIGTYGATWPEALNIVLAGANQPLSPSQVANVALEEVEGSPAVVHGFAASKLPARLVSAEIAGPPVR